jgi:hypothetical protein
MIEAVDGLVKLLDLKSLSIARLRRILFGARTEKSAAVFPAEAPAKSSEPRAKPKRKGHGRRPASSYRGAKRVQVNHPTLRAGDVCSACKKGKLRRQPKPAPVIEVQASPPISATVFEKEVLRCSLCGKTFTAPTPPEVGEQTYHRSVGVMIALLRYGSGMPFNRLQTLQTTLEIPLPSSIQWEEASKAAEMVRPVWEHLQREAAQAPSVFNDDTGMRVGELRRQIRQERDPERTGIFTTGIVAKGLEHVIALFFTGRKHAGERLEEVLQHRNTDLPPPLQMCDGLSRNVPKEFKTLLGCCLGHGRRPFVDVAESFPDDTRYVLKSLRVVYRVDARSKSMGHCPEGRLAFHLRRSKPVMEKLKIWLDERIELKLVEPNSGLGQAINFMRGHWEELTLFLREPGAPLDNNICERALKMAILHRKNSLSYKTQHGAEVGDLFMSLIHTCRLNGFNPFDYLMALTGNPQGVAADPARWLPWNYQETLAAALPQAISA